MTLDLHDKVALVTGGSAGLGAEIVRKLAAEGVNVAINYANRQEPADRLASHVQETFHVRTAVVQGDVSKKADLEKIVNETIKIFGKINIVVSNAGWTRMIPFSNIEELTEDDFTKCFNVNVTSHFSLFKLTKQYLESDPDGGSFLVTASIAGRRPTGSSIAYSCSKTALIRLVETLAKSQGPKIRVNAICPGLLLTEWGLKFGHDIINSIETALPLKHAPGIDDTADAFVFAAKNKSQTGATISIDSGSFVL